MKIKIIVFIFFCTSLHINSQTNSEIAGVYIKRAEQSFQKSEIENSLKIFNKALKYIDTISDSRIARLGMLLHYETKEYFLARSYSYDYFKLVKDKTTADYDLMLEIFVNIMEEIDEFKIEQKRLETERKIEEAEQRRVDSLKRVWSSNSEKFIINIDSLSKFNGNNIAVYKKGDAYGLIDDLGNIAEEATNYKHVISYDNFILLLRDKEKPTKIYCYNSNTKKGFVLPSVETFNSKSTHYGKVMLPRGNGDLVTYPNNSKKVFVYNLVSKEFKADKDQIVLLKELKKNDIIDKYNKEGQVKINKAWYYLGGKIGAGIYALYKGENRLHGFLNTSNGNVLSQEYYNHLGAFYNGNFELIENDKTFWMNDEGIRQEVNRDESGKYHGLSRFLKLREGEYQIIQNIDGQDYIVLGNEKLINQKAFIAKEPR
ncbi:hypothetical protein MNBD_BACTEROID02-2001 [hydrothermal vent metagenome]|uniref:Uncharacterized protein n=1 Tax=hydrothermal vent metagenome TaxID=652676 RepID=A0A3B0R555_9ZZZZ